MRKYYVESATGGRDFEDLNSARGFVENNVRKACVIRAWDTDDRDSGLGPRNHRLVESWDGTSWE